MYLSNGLPWSLPVTLAASEDEAKKLKEGYEISLVDSGGEPIATMLLRESYSYDKEREARMVYRTTDAEHPGVAALYRQGEVLLGGEVTLLKATAAPSPATITGRASCAPLSTRKAGNASSVFRPGTRSTVLTSTFRRALWKPWMVYS